MLSKLAIRRLTKLADFMDALPRSANGHFDMGTFFNHEGGHRLTDKASAIAELDCGTSACALGFATAVPSFRKAGLVWDRNGVIRFGDRSFDYAANAFFDANVYDDLFSSALESIATPKQWAKHCRKFLKANS